MPHNKINLTGANEIENDNVNTENPSITAKKRSLFVNNANERAAEAGIIEMENTRMHTWNRSCSSLSSEIHIFFIQDELFTFKLLQIKTMFRLFFHELGASLK